MDTGYKVERQLIADLSDGPAKSLVPKGVHRNPHSLTQCNLSDIRFVDVGPDTKPTNVAYGCNRRRREIADGLSGFAIQFQYDAIER